MEEISGLKRELNLVEITLTGIGNILGAGIYVLMGKAAGLAGYFVWFSFLLQELLPHFLLQLYGTLFYVSASGSRV